MLGAPSSSPTVCLHFLRSEGQRASPIDKMSFWTDCLRRPLTAPSFSSYQYPISSFHPPRNSHSSITTALPLCHLVYNYIFYLQNADTLDIHIPSPQASRAWGLAFAPTVAPSTTSHSLPVLSSRQTLPSGTAALYLGTTFSTSLPKGLGFHICEITNMKLNSPTSLSSLKKNLPHEKAKKLFCFTTSGWGAAPSKNEVRHPSYTWEPAPLLFRAASNPSDPGPHKVTQFLFFFLFK